MKKVTCAVIVMLFFVSGADARGENKKLNWENLKTALFVLVPAYFTQVAIHEGSHAIAAKSFGAEITEFSIFPSMHDGHFYFGHVGTNMSYSATAGQRALFYISPKITNICVFTLTEAAFMMGFARNSPQLATALFVFGELVPWIDFTVGVIYSSDMKQFESATGLPPSFTRLMGATISLIGLAFLYERAKKIFFTTSRGKISERFGVSIAEGGAIVFRGKF